MFLHLDIQNFKAQEWIEENKARHIPSNSWAYSLIPFSGKQKKDFAGIIAKEEILRSYSLEIQMLGSVLQLQYITWKKLKSPIKISLCYIHVDFLWVVCDLFATFILKWPKAILHAFCNLYNTIFYTSIIIFKVLISIMISVSLLRPWDN